MRFFIYIGVKAIRMTSFRFEISFTDKFGLVCPLERKANTACNSVGLNWILPREQFLVGVLCPRKLFELEGTCSLNWFKIRFVIRKS